MDSPEDTTTMKWIVVVDRPFYPEVTEFTDPAEAARAYADEHDEDGGEHITTVYLVKVEAERTIRTTH